MDTLIEYLKAKKPNRFAAKPYYSAEGDSVTFYFKDAQSYAKRADNFLTVYLSIENEELVGCQVKGVATILKRLGEFGFSVEDKSVKLGMFFMACMAETPVEDAKEQYRKVNRLARGASIPSEQLNPAFA